MPILDVEIVLQPGEMLDSQLTAAIADRVGQLFAIARLTEIIAQTCGRPAENVHLCYEPAGAGRAAFGGKLV